MILITGATGFLGRHIVAELISRGHELRILVRDPESRQLPWQAMVDIAEGDILDVTSLHHSLEGVDTVIHAAAQVSFWKKQHQHMTQINVEGTANIVNACLEQGIKKLIHVSSIAALGKKSDQSLIDENTPWVPSKSHSKYSISKHKAELEVYRGIAEGLPNALIINPGVIIGPTHDWTNNTGKIFSMIYKGLRFYNGGASGFVGVKDVANAIALLLEKQPPNGSRFILVSENLSQKAFLDQIARALQKPSPSLRLPDILSMGVASLSQLISEITHTEPIITPESIRGSISRYRYDGGKITQWGWEYTPIHIVIEEAAEAFLIAHNASSSVV